MTFQIDERLPWTEHYVRYGFAVVRGLVDRGFCDEALAEVRRVVDDDRPVTRWVKRDGDGLNDPSASPGQWHYAFFQDPGRTGMTPQNPVLETLYDQPRLRAAIDEMFGDARAWDRVRNYYIFLNPFAPHGEAKLEPAGHIDFRVPTPILYRGFTFQIALLDTEPFSGNTTIFPGTHVPVQRMLMDEADRDLTQQAETDVDTVEPYEFVAGAGDVLFMHHLVYHSGNVSHSPNCRPRLGLHAEAFRARWLTEVDPGDPDLSPWQRSLALNGPFIAQRDEATPQRSMRERYVTQIEKELGIAVEERWKRYSDWPEPPS
ncbi:MAG: hypothetical protein CMJ18_01475 [Phycisphaeraceae bacterium]|nr:hypothetical protein [Phycisphaeraceae bacterium]